MAMPVKTQPVGPMHRIWRIPEVVDMIASSSVIKHGTLVGLARTNSCFFDASVTRIWKAVDALDLLSLFHIADKDPARVKSTKYLDRYAIYLRSVRSLTLDVSHYEDDPAQSEMNYYNTLLGIAHAISLRQPHFLPNLHHLRVFAGFDEMDLQMTTTFFAAAGLFLSNSMISLHVQLNHIRGDDIDLGDLPEEDAEEIRILEFLRLIKPKCPGLQRFTIVSMWANRATTSFLDTLGDVISGLNHLKRFEGGLWTLTAPVFSALGRLPALEILLISPEDEERDVDDSRASPEAIRSIGVGLFPSLQYLQLDGSPEVIEACLRACSESRELEDLLIKTHHSTFPLVRIAEAIGTQFLHLESLEWDDTSDPAVPAGTCVEILAALEPCKALVDLTLRICRKITGHETDPISLADVAAAWPHIHEIHLCERHNFAFHEVAHYAEKCSSLRSVSLALSRDPDTAAPRDIAPASDKPVKYNILTRPAQLAPVLASFLYSLWPNVVIPKVIPVDFDTRNTVLVDARKEWEPVITIIKALRTHTALHEAMESK